MDNKTLDELLEKGAKGESISSFFKYKGINPEQAFEDRDFLIHFSNLSKVKRYEKQIKDTKGNPAPDVRRDLAGILYQDEGVGLKLSDLIIRDSAKQGRKSLQRNMVQYVQNNYHKFLSTIDEDEKANEIYTNIVFSIPLCYIQDKKHDTIVTLISRVKEAEAAAATANEKGDMGKMRKIAESKIKDRNIPDWGVKLLKQYLFDETFLKLVFKEEYQSRQQLALMALTSDGQNIDRDKVKGVIEDSLIEAQVRYNKAGEMDNKGDIYDDNVVPIYEKIAEAAAPIVHDRYMRDLRSKNKEVRDASDRADDNARAGIGVGMQDLAEIAEKYDMAGK